MKPAAAMNDLKHRPKGENLQSLRWLGRYLRPYKYGVAGALAALAVTSVAVLGLGAGLRYLVDEGISKGNPELLNQAVWILAGVTLLLAGASFARSFLVAWVGERVVADIRRDVYEHVIRMDLPFFEETSSGEILSRLTTDTTLLQTVVGSSLSMALRNVLLLAGGTVLLLVTSAKLTGYVTIIVPLVVVPIILLGRRVRMLSRSAQDRVADLSAMAGETFNAVPTIQAFCLEKAESRRFGERVKQAFEMAMARVKTRSLLTALVIALIFGAVSAVLWIGGQSVIAGEITPGELSSFLFYAVVVAGAVGGISDVIGDLQRAAGATERLHELLNVQPAITIRKHPLKLRDPVQGRINMEKVTFHYPSRPDKASLKDFTLEVKPGERVALVGPSGAGKTTVMNLLLRFYDPQRGNILFDGMDIKMLDPVLLRKFIGLVPQDTVIFSASAADNIRIGRPEAGNRELIEAAEAAAAMEFLQKLPDGLDTHLGERGVRLSGGQRQRIAIARAILKNPRVLLLDEATSALDAESEKLVQQGLEELMKDRTTLVIAHRLATVLKADRIIVMNEGRLEASGTHAQLLKSSELYARLAKLQFTETAIPSQ